jgi:hypothetical protein
MSDPDIYLLSTERAISEFGLSEIEADDIFFVNNGTGPLEGRRFKNVFIDYMCYKNENYEACLDLLFINRDLMEQFGSLVLI